MRNSEQKILHSELTLSLILFYPLPAGEIPKGAGHERMEKDLVRSLFQ